MTIIARSRIGFWTALSTDEGSFLNVRGQHGESITVLLTSADVAMLAADAEVCHPYARMLAGRGPFVVPSLATPLRGFNEPEPHEWQPRKDPSLSVIETRKAA